MTLTIKTFRSGVLCLLFVGTVSSSLFSNANSSVVGLCNRTETYLVSRTETRQGFVNQIHYKYDWGKARRVSFYRNDVVYYLVTVTSLAQRDVEVCCDGYKNVSTSSGGYNCLPVCSPACVHGTCDAPDSCTCRTPYTGAACTHVACTGTTICFPGACQPLQRNVVCDCPAGFSGLSAGASGCRTMTSGPTLEDCSLTLSAGSGQENVTVACSSSQPAYFSLTSVAELLPNISVLYTGPVQLPNTTHVTAHWFGVISVNLTHSVNGGSTNTSGVSEAPSQVLRATAPLAISPPASLQHGENITIVIMAVSGGYRLSTFWGNESFYGYQEVYDLVFINDLEPPSHCSQDTPPCSDAEIELQKVPTRGPVLSRFNTQLYFPGWSDYPAGIRDYEYSVLEEDGAFITSGIWTPTTIQPGFPRDPEKSYRVRLTVTDNAGNKRTTQHSERPLQEPKKPLNATLVGAVVAFAAALTLVLATVVVCAYRRWRAGAKRQKTRIELGKFIEFRGRHQQNNKFANFRKCSVSANGQRWSGVAKILQDQHSPEDYKIMFEKEIFWNVSKLHHRNVIKFLGSSSSAQGPVLAFEYCKVGNLNDLLHNWKFGNQDQNQLETMQEIGVQVAFGLSYLHSKEILHKKLTCRHVVLSQEAVGVDAEHNPQRYCAKIIGFDPSKNSGNKPMRWVAPEISLRPGECKYSKASDVYNFAMFFFELMSYGDLPWRECHSHEEANTRAQQGEIPAKPQEMELQMYECLASTAIKIVPSERSTMADIASTLDGLYCSGNYSALTVSGVDPVYYISHNELNRDDTYNDACIAETTFSEHNELNDIPEADRPFPVVVRSKLGRYNYAYRDGNTLSSAYLS